MFPKAERMSASQPIQKPEAGVVPGFSIGRTRIAKAYQQFNPGRQRQPCQVR
jgi:hypothetical protein